MAKYEACIIELEEAIDMKSLIWKVYEDYILIISQLENGQVEVLEIS